MLSHIAAWTEGRPLLPALRKSGRFLTIPLIGVNRPTSSDDQCIYTVKQVNFVAFFFLRIENYWQFSSKLIMGKTYHCCEYNITNFAAI